jgi:hypothetical protein
VFCPILLLLFHSKSPGFLRSFPHSLDYPFLSPIITHSHHIASNDSQEGLHYFPFNHLAIASQSNAPRSLSFPPPLFNLYVIKFFDGKGRVTFVRLFTD